jgi:flagellar hook protein FlgE
VDLSNSLLIPRATTSVSVNVNLDPTSPMIMAPVDHLHPDSSMSYQTGIHVFDSLGNAHTVQIYFRRTGANAWEWYAGAQRGDFDMTDLGVPQGPSVAQDQFVVAQSGSLKFATDGTLLTESNAPLAIALDADGDGVLDASTVTTAQIWPWSVGAMAARIAFDFGTPVASGGTGADLTTQFGGGNFVRMIDQDGYASGSLQSIAIEIDGSVMGGFSNGQTAILAKVALATFAGTYWLERIDDTKDYRQTALSGPPIFGSAHQAGYGTIRSGYLEDLCSTPQRLCDSLPPLELCEQKLAECEATGRLDADADGEPDLSDHCPDTAAFADVDAAGCSQRQFCTGIRIREGRDRLRCSLSDWKNDEPISFSPQDCLIRSKRSGRQVCSPRH